MIRKLCFADETPSSKEEQKARLRAYMKGKRAENVNRDVKEQRLIEHFIRRFFPKWVGQVRV